MNALDRAKPLSEISTATAKKIVAIASDIDDTISSDGKIPAGAYAALWQAKEAGLIVVPVTGRPAGWCDFIARMWPVDGVVGENGALYFRNIAGAGAGSPGRIKRHWIVSTAERAKNRRRLDEVATEILKSVPGCAIASDQAYREFDLAIDFCEDVARLADPEIDRIVAIFEKHGCTAKVSSIHVNGWYGKYDKLGMIRTFFAQEFGIDVDAARETILFCGDSPNDEPMFAHFPVSVGMSNIADFAARVKNPPGYITRARAGEGFAETIAALLLKRR